MCNSIPTSQQIVTMYVVQIFVLLLIHRTESEIYTEFIKQNHLNNKRRGGRLHAEPPIILIVQIQFRDFASYN